MRLSRLHAARPRPLFPRLSPPLSQPAPSRGPADGLLGPPSFGFTVNLRWVPRPRTLVSQDKSLLPTSCRMFNALSADTSSASE